MDLIAIAPPPHLSSGPGNPLLLQPSPSSLSITSSDPSHFPPAAAAASSGLHQCPNSSKTSMEIQGKEAQPS